MPVSGYGWNSLKRFQFKISGTTILRCAAVRLKAFDRNNRQIFYVGEGEAEAVGEGVLTEAFSREALIAFNKTMEVYLLSSA